MGRKPQTLQEQIAASLTRLGIQIAPEIEQNLGVQKEQSRNAEAVVEWVRAPDKFKHRSCSVCTTVFLVNYPSVAMCSDKCRREHLRRIGIEWDSNKPVEARWSPADVPLVIPAPALRGLLLALLQTQSGVALLQSSLPKYLSLCTESQSQDSPAELDTLDKSSAMQD